MPAVSLMWLLSAGPMLWGLPPYLCAAATVPGKPLACHMVRLQGAARSCQVVFSLSQYYLRCGDGNLDAADGELCDDGNNADGDGCTSACKEEPPRSSNSAPVQELTWGQGKLLLSNTCFDDVRCFSDFSRNAPEWLGESLGEWFRVQRRNKIDNLREWTNHFEFPCL